MPRLPGLPTEASTLHSTLLPLASYPVPAVVWPIYFGLLRVGVVLVCSSIPCHCPRSRPPSHVHVISGSYIGGHFPSCVDFIICTPKPFKNPRRPSRRKATSSPRLLVTLDRLIVRPSTLSLPLQGPDDTEWRAEDPVAFAISKLRNRADD